MEGTICCRAGKCIPPEAHARHRAEIIEFANEVAGAEVRFSASSWREWLKCWTKDTRGHADALMARFEP